MYSVENFIQNVKRSEGLVCYGVGKRFEKFIQCFQQYGIIDKILFCVDKNIKLHETKIDLGTKVIDILPIESLDNVKTKNIIVLITNYRYDEVLSDTLSKKYLQGMNYYCFTHLYGTILEDLAMKKEIPADYHLTNKAVIPKTIHYCWFGHNPLPDKYKKWMESWHKYCPDYEIKEWNEENYDVTQNRYMYEAYQNKKWGFVPDYARLDIIYKYGGIYLDTDVEIIQNLDDLLYQKGFIGFEQESYIAFGLGFGAVKGLPIIKEIRDSYNEISFINSDGSLNLTASPVYQTAFLLNKGLKPNGEYQIINDLTVFPEKLLCGKSPHTQRIRLTSYTKSIHHYDASWKDEQWHIFCDLLKTDMDN